MRRVVLVFCMGSFALPASADFQWQASTLVATEHSNNIGLDSTDERSDTRADLGVSLGFEATHSRYTAIADYDFRRDYYSKDTFDETTTVEGTLSLNALLLPRRLSWFVSHSQENSRIDSRLRDTPDNREERSILSTGPRLFLYPSKRDTVTLSAGYSEVDLEENRQNNSERTSASADWVRLMSRTSNLGFNARSEQVVFVERDDLDYDRHSLSVSYSGQGALFDYRAALGGNLVEPEQGDSLDGAFVQIELSRTDGATSYSLDVNRQLTDTVFGDGEIDVSTGTGAITEPNVGEVGIIERTEVGVSVSRPTFDGRLDTGYQLTYGRDKGKDEVATDQTTYQLVADFRFELTGILEPFLTFEATRVEFDEGEPREDDNLRVETGLAYLPSPRAEVVFSVAHEDNSSNLEENDYDELSAGISFTYLFGSQY